MDYTLVFLIDRSTSIPKVMLGFKKRGFLAYTWHGFGGKLNHNEDPLEGAKRELREESGISDAKLDYSGIVHIWNHDDNGDKFNRIFLYTSTEWTGEAVETEEILPAWFVFDNDLMPYENMSLHYRTWLGYILKGEIIETYLLMYNGELQEYDTIIKDTNFELKIA